MGGGQHIQKKLRFAPHDKTGQRLNLSEECDWFYSSTVRPETLVGFRYWHKIAVMVRRDKPA
jgi:hypothetical protein